MRCCRPNRFDTPKPLCLIIARIAIPPMLATAEAAGQPSQAQRSDCDGRSSAVAAARGPCGEWQLSVYSEYSTSAVRCRHSKVTQRCRSSCTWRSRPTSSSRWHCGGAQWCFSHRNAQSNPTLRKELSWPTMPCHGKTCTDGLCAECRAVDYGDIQRAMRHTTCSIHPYRRTAERLLLRCCNCAGWRARVLWEPSSLSAVGCSRRCWSISSWLRCPRCVRTRAIVAAHMQTAAKARRRCLRCRSCWHSARSRRCGRQRTATAAIRISALLHSTVDR